jgi:DNA-binding transcriptional regulator GbsR (MarR family)
MINDAVYKNKLNKVISILNDKEYLTITEIVNSTGLSRSFVRIALVKLEGGKKVGYRKIGMAKAYFLRRKK